MTSTSLYRLFEDVSGHRAQGNLEVPEFDRLFNAAQIDHARFLLPEEAAYLDRRSECNFMHVYAHVQLTNGVGAWATRTGDKWIVTDINGDSFELLSGCLPFHRTANPVACGSAPGAPIRVPIRILTDSEFSTATMSELFAPSIKYPISYMTTIGNEKRIEVLPTVIQYAECLCWRVPRPIKVGTDPLVTTYVKPLEGAADQIDPEWDPASCLKILQRVLRSGGVAISDNELFQAAGIMGGQL